MPSKPRKKPKPETRTSDTPAKTQAEIPKKSVPPAKVVYETAYTSDTKFKSMNEDEFMSKVIGE